MEFDRNRHDPDFDDDYEIDDDTVQHFRDEVLRDIRRGRLKIAGAIAGAGMLVFFGWLFWSQYAVYKEQVPLEESPEFLAEMGVQPGDNVVSSMPSGEPEIISLTRQEQEPSRPANPPKKPVKAAPEKEAQSSQPESGLVKETDSTTAPEPEKPDTKSGVLPETAKSATAPEPEKPAEAVAAVPEKKSIVVDYTLYIGKYTDKTAAEKAAGSVSKAGYNAAIEESSGAQLQYYIHVGHYESEGDAKHIMAELKAMDVVTRMMRLQSGGISLNAGYFDSTEQARKFQSWLVGEGYPAKIVGAKKRTTLYRLKVGPFDSKEKASDATNRLANAGLGKGEVIAVKR